MPPSRTTSKHQLVYLAFGPKTYHDEAIFSIASAFSFLNTAQRDSFEVQVFTDKPEAYKRLPIKIQPFDNKIRHEWSAPHGYHFRCKHVAMQHVLENSDHAILIDTDTFFKSSPLELFKRIEPGTLLCNALGGSFIASKPYGTLYENTATHLQKKGLAPDSMPLLNSGAIGLYSQDKYILDDSIRLMDELFPMAAGAYTLEEFCLAVACHEQVKLNTCTDIIHHYWSRKDIFRAKIQAWLSIYREAPISAQALENIKLVNDRLPRPPRHNRLFNKAASLAMPVAIRQFFREIMNGCYNYPNIYDQACQHAWWDKALKNLEEKSGTSLTSKELSQHLDHPVLTRLTGSHYNTLCTYYLKKLSTALQPTGAVESTK